MASVYDLKPRFQARLRPYVQRLADRGTTPNQITAAALVLSMLHGLWIGSGFLTVLALLALPVTLFARMALNAIDGLLAREHEMRSRLGGLFNELADVAADAALYLPLALLAGMPGWALVAVVTLGLIAEYAGAIGPQIGASRRYEGPFGKSDRAVYFGLMAVLLALGLLGGTWLWSYLALGAALALWCTWNRVRRALSEAAVNAKQAAAQARPQD